ncbi:MAG: ABC transporter substrate-binding protein, partial [Acidimicrobiales bacterium]
MPHPGRRLALASALALAVLSAACAGDTEQAAPDAASTGQVGGSIAYAAGQEPTGFNLGTSKDNILELRHIMGRVWPVAYVVQPDLSLVPSPALDGPARVTSQDPFTVEWKIAAAATWDDGVPLTAEDFEWVYRSCNDDIDPGEPTITDEAGQPKSGLDCASSAGYDKVTRFETLSPKLFRMTFAQRVVEYEQLFGEGLPPAHIGRARPGGWNTGFDADPGASAGPYRLKEAVKGDHYTLERNPRYWGPRPKLDTIVFREVPDLASHPDDLRNDEVQVIYTQPQIDLVQQLAAIPATSSKVTFGPTWEHLDMNFKNPLLARKEIRQAIALGLDRDRYVTTLMKPFSPQAKRLDNRIFMSTQPEYEAHGQPYAKRSPAAAQAALEKAGFAKGTDGIYAKGGQRLAFRIRAKTPNPLREQMEQLMQEDLKGVGIELRIDNFSEPESIGS